MHTSKHLSAARAQYLAQPRTVRARLCVCRVALCIEELPSSYSCLFSQPLSVPDLCVAPICMRCRRDVPNNSGIVGKLSPELKDLLDKIFEVKQVRVIAHKEGKGWPLAAH